MKEVTIKNKKEYLEENYPFVPVPKLTDQKRCVHCDTVFTVGDFNVFMENNGEEFICCPNAPDCDGTVIDWITVD